MCVCVCICMCIYMYMYVYEKNVLQSPAERLSQLVATWLNLNHRSWSQRYHDHSIFVRTATMLAVFLLGLRLWSQYFVRTAIIVAVFYEDCYHGHNAN